jgi:hypothetical protein
VQESFYHALGAIHAGFKVILGPLFHPGHDVLRIHDASPQNFFLTNTSYSNRISHAREDDILKRSLVLIGVTVLLSMLLLPSCFYPEVFNITLNIDKTGAYSFVFDGTLVSITMDQQKDESLLHDQDLERARELEGVLKKNTHFQEVKYAGKGRFKVLYRQEGAITSNSELKFLDGHCALLTIEPSEPGQVIIKGATLGKNTLEYLKKLDFTLAGKLTVTTNARVIRHNADRSPWLFGLLGSYAWQINLTPFPEPWMLLQLE